MEILLPVNNNQIVLFEETSAGKVYWDYDNKIIHVEMHDNVKSVETAKEIIDAEERICQKLNISKAGVLVDLLHVNEISKEARDYFANERTFSIQIAAALLVPTAVSKIIGNFCMGFNKPIGPTQLFTDSQKAINWLSNFSKN